MLNLLFILCVIQQRVAFLENGDVLSLLLIAGWLMPLFVNWFTLIIWLFFVRRLEGISRVLRIILFINLFFLLFQTLFFLL